MATSLVPKFETKSAKNGTFYSVAKGTIPKGGVPPTCTNLVHGTNVDGSSFTSRCTGKVCTRAKDLKEITHSWEHQRCLDCARRELNPPSTDKCGFVRTDKKGRPLMKDGVVQSCKASPKPGYSHCASHVLDALKAQAIADALQKAKSQSTEESQSTEDLKEDASGDESEQTAADE